MRVRVRDDPSRGELAATTFPLVLTSTSVPKVGDGGDAPPPPDPLNGDLLLLEPPVVSREGFESPREESANPAAIWSGDLTVLDASSRGEAVRPASWRVRHIALAAMMCCGKKCENEG